jgi:PAS domain S-box-containing protein
MNIPVLGGVMEKKNILIIDDDQNLLKTLSDILGMKGYEVFTAGGGIDAMNFIGQSPIDLAIIDLGLPDISGLDVLGSIKSSAPVVETIVLTGNASLDAAIEAINRGAFSYLLKPYDMEQLMVHIRRALEKQEIAETLRKSEARYRMLAENARDLIWTLDCSGRLTYISPSVEFLRGVTPEEAMRESSSNAITPESEKIAKADMEEILQNAAMGKKRSPRVHEIEFLRKGGGTIWMEVSSTGLYDAAGKLLGILCAGRDISDRRKAEDEKNRLIAELQEALGKIKTITGLLPICTVCKKIRDDKGKWEELEVYIRDHSEADFSHGICSECLGKIYPATLAKE